MVKPKITLVALCVIFFTACTQTLIQHSNNGTKVNVATDMLALEGYDLVSYQMQAPVRGSTQFAAKHNGVTYRFSTSLNREVFLRNPKIFMPEYGGFCAYGISGGTLYDGDPQAWTVVNGKLYLNINKDVQSLFAKDPIHYITLADKNWMKLQ